METKICKGCGKELPLSDYHKDERMIGGHKNYCRECVSKQEEEKKKVKKAMQEDNPLSAFKPRELIEELRKRGYRGKLQYVYEITL